MRGFVHFLSFLNIQQSSGCREKVLIARAFASVMVAELSAEENHPITEAEHDPSKEMQAIYPRLLRELFQTDLHDLVPNLLTVIFSH
jgi:hypothetical protein